MTPLLMARRRARCALAALVLALWAPFAAAVLPIEQWTTTRGARATVHQLC